MNNSSSLFWFVAGLMLCSVLVIVFVGINSINSFNSSKTTQNTQTTPTLLTDKVLGFASLFIFGLLMAFLLSMGMYYWSDNTNTTAGKDVFEGCKSIIIPLVSIVIGYYFGKKS